MIQRVAPDRQRQSQKFGYQRIVEMFDKDETAGHFLREDGEGGFASGVYRMAREIDRLRAKCGEPPAASEKPL